MGHRILFWLSPWKIWALEPAWKPSADERSIRGAERGTGDESAVGNPLGRGPGVNYHKLLTLGMTDKSRE